MSRMLETGVISYLASVAVRTIGIHGAIEGIESQFPFESEHARGNARFFGVFGFVSQTIIPTAHETVRRFPQSDALPLVMMEGCALDALSTIPAIFWSHNIEEAIVLKLLANTATHMALDFAGVVTREIGKTRFFRPPLAQR